MQNKIVHSVEDAIRAMLYLKQEVSLDFMQKVAEAISSCYNQGGKILVAGNGGSLCDAMHFCEELTGLFRRPRPALGAIALSDPGHLSCVANDMGYEFVFSRAVEALGKPGDVFIALTTSGNSSNLVRAVDVAKERGLVTVAFLGKSGGQLKGKADLEWIVGGFTYSDRIQEAHMTAIHIIIERVEELVFGSALEEKELAHVH